MALTPISHLLRFRSATALLLAAIALAPVSAFAQPEEGPDEPEDAQPGYSSLAVSQPKGTRELQNALQRLALNPGDIDALIDGGNAALLLGDPQAAIGFFARADEMDPGNGRVKAGLGSGLLLNENPYEALRLFGEAKRLGVPDTVFASDRGLAYDLVGNFDAAQADYELALRRGGDDETIRRYALSLAISGERAAAEAQLEPLLQKRDAAAWRTRAFVLAVAGDPQGAIAIADATMPQRMAESIQPFFRFMGRLTPAQQAAAAHFGQFPQTAAIGKDDPRNRQYASAGSPRVRSARADAGLIPAGEPLGQGAEGTARKPAKADKAQRRRPGRLSRKDREQVAAAQAGTMPKPAAATPDAPKPAAQAVAVAGPVPPSDLLIPRRDPQVQPSPAPAPAPAPGTVQPVPGAVRLATVDAAPAAVQPLPGAAQPDLPKPTEQQLAQARVTAIRPSVRDAIRQPSAAAPSTLAGTVAQGETEKRGVTAPTAAGQSAPAPAPAPAVAGPVLLAGVTELPRPGFVSIPAQPGAGAPAPVAANVTASTDPAQSPSQPGATAASSPPSPSPASGRSPEPLSLAAVIASITVPAQELAPDPDAVDISTLRPSSIKPADTPQPNSSKPDPLKADGVKVDVKAPDPKKPDPKKPEAKKPEAKKAAAKPAPPKHPKRYWVQVAGGANRAGLTKEWKRLTGEAPAAFKGKQGWWTPLNATNRLLTGPFDSAGDAQGFVNTLAKSNLSAFTFTSPEGQEVTQLGK